MLASLTTKKIHEEDLPDNRGLDVHCMCDTISLWVGQSLQGLNLRVYDTCSALGHDGLKADGNIHMAQIILIQA